MKSWLRLLSRGGTDKCYRSTVKCASQTMPGVRFRIRRISLGRRIALAEAIRGLAAKMEFHQAKAGVEDQVKAATLAASIDRVYLTWGLVSVSGLRIDGAPASVERLYEDGPEEFTREVISRIKSECGLSEQERKN